MVSRLLRVGVAIIVSILHIIQCSFAVNNYWARVILSRLIYRYVISGGGARDIIYYNCGGAAQNSVTVPREWLFAHTLGSRERHNPRQERTDLRGVQDARLWVQERLRSASTQPNAVCVYSQVDDVALFSAKLQILLSRYPMVSRLLRVGVAIIVSILHIMQCSFADNNYWARVIVRTVHHNYYTFKTYII